MIKIISLSWPFSCFISFFPPHLFYMGTQSNMLDIWPWLCMIPCKTYGVSFICVCSLHTSSGVTGLVLFLKCFCMHVCPVFLMLQWFLWWVAFHPIFFFSFLAWTQLPGIAKSVILGWAYLQICVSLGVFPGMESWLCRVISSRRTAGDQFTLSLAGDEVLTWYFLAA